MTWERLLDWLEEYKELLAIFVALLGGLTALFRYWTDLSWQRRQFAFDYADKILADPACQLAMTMIDWYASKAVVPKELAGGREGVTIAWGERDVGHALRLNDSRYSLTEFAIRNAFDAFLNRLERLAYFVDKGTLSRSDFPEVLAYYFRRVRKRADLGDTFFNYAAYSGFELTAKLGRKISAGVEPEAMPGDAAVDINLAEEMQFGPVTPERAGG